jgi:hypothetical protein
MSPKSKREYLIITKERYNKAKRKKKTKILDEFCATYGCHRKHALRLLNTPLVPPIKTYKRQGRPPVYNNKLLRKALKSIWLHSNLPCGKRLKAILPLWLPSYQTHFGELPEDILGLLQSISPATIDRILKVTRIKYTKGRSTTKPGSLLRKHIPIKTDQWDETRPGFLETDTVAHCGTSTAGTYANTINFVDIATGWTEQRAIWCKGALDVITQVQHVEKTLPFALLGFDCDNGSEFINHHLVRHFHNHKPPVHFTRSRAYRKNDNAHVEQKNWTHVRQWLGYDRFDNQRVVPALNKLYTQEWRLFHNFFCPSVKLIEKKRIGAQTIKKHDCPKTPYQRILDSQHIPQNIKDQLTALFTSLDPFSLRKGIEKKTKKVFDILRR